MRLHPLPTHRNISKRPFSPTLTCRVVIPSVGDISLSVTRWIQKVDVTHTALTYLFELPLKTHRTEVYMQFRNRLDEVLSNTGLPLAIEGQKYFLCYSRRWAAIYPLDIFSWKIKYFKVVFNCCYSSYRSYAREAVAWMSLLATAVTSKYAQNYFYFAHFFHYYY